MENSIQEQEFARTSFNVVCEKREVSICKNVYSFKTNVEWLTLLQQGMQTLFSLAIEAMMKEDYAPMVADELAGIHFCMRFNEDISKAINDSMNLLMNPIPTKEKGGSNE